MAELGERVRVDFEGRLKDGAKFSSSYLVGEPFEFVVGSHQMLPAFERAVVDMVPGESKTITIPALQAYGEYDESLVEEVPVAAVPNADKLPVGGYVVFNTADGEMRVKVLGVRDGKVLFDHNHELAGQDLVFDITLLEVVHESAVEKEKHPVGCACGCARVKHILRDGDAE